MFTGTTRAFSPRSAAAAIFLVLAAVSSTESSGQSLLNFERFKGHWTGSGWFSYGDGHRERASCEVNVRSYGRPDRGGIDFACTAGTTSIRGRAFDVTLEGPKAAGSWELPSYAVAGVLSGRVTSAKFEVTLRPQTLIFANYYGRLAVSVPGDCHATAIASIEAPTALKNITILLRRC